MDPTSRALHFLDAHREVDVAILLSKPRPVLVA